MEIQFVFISSKIPCTRIDPAEHAGDQGICQDFVPEFTDELTRYKSMQSSIPDFHVHTRERYPH